MAVELNPRDGWAQHAVAHVIKMQGRPRDGIAWMRANPDAWSKDSFFQVHNWWYLALYHLELGEIDEVLVLFDGPIHGPRSPMVLDLIDASALLWRLHLRGVDVGDRWSTVADGWLPVAAAGNYAFNDLHAVMALAVAGRGDVVKDVLDTQQAAMARGDDNAAFTREVGHPLTRAIKAFADDDSPALMTGGYYSIASVYKGVETLVERFRDGQGIRWGDHDGCLFCGVAKFFRPSYRAGLVQEWLPALDGVVDKLDCGARVADVGCGYGSSTIISTDQAKTCSSAAPSPCHAMPLLVEAEGPFG